MKKVNKKLFSKKLKLHENDFNKLLNLCLKNFRKRVPKSYDYKTLIKIRLNENKLERIIIGYIKDKKEFSNIISYLLTSDYIKINYDEKYLIEFLEKILIEYFEGKITEKKDIAKTIFKKLKDLSEWEFFYPLDNIQLEMSNFRLGNYEIVNFTDYQYRKLKKKANTYLISNSSSKEIKKSHLDRIKKESNVYLKNKICAKIKVTSGSPLVALEESEKELILFMSAIKFISWLWYPNYNKNRILYLHHNFDRHYITYGYSEESGGYFSYKNKNPLPYEMNKHNSKQMLSYGAKNISNLLKIDNKERTPFQKMILHSIGMYGDAISDRENSSSYVKLITILEYLLIREKEIIAKNLSERIAFILHKLFQYRQAISENVKRLYKIRCAIVHNGKKDISDKELKKINRLVFNIILLMLNCHKKFRDKNDFLEVLEKIKFGKKFSFMKKQIIIGECW